jgi:predicted alpha-1,2-mannosidase
MGGKKNFVNKLQKVFDEDLFDMANEPDIHYPYLFNYWKGEEWRSQKEVQKLIKNYYKNSPGGIPGNDDCGTLSAWIVYSMMGMYPVCPGDTDYALTTPVFDKITIQLDPEFHKGKTWEIVKSAPSQNEESEFEFIQNIQLNGKDYKSYFINHDEIVKGGKIEMKIK